MIILLTNLHHSSIFVVIPLKSSGHEIQPRFSIPRMCSTWSTILLYIGRIKRHVRKNISKKQRRIPMWKHSPLQKEFKILVNHLMAIEYHKICLKLPMKPIDTEKYIKRHHENGTLHHLHSPPCEGILTTIWYVQLTIPGRIPWLDTSYHQTMDKRGEDVVIIQQQQQQQQQSKPTSKQQIQKLKKDILTKIVPNHSKKITFQKTKNKNLPILIRCKSSKKKPREQSNNKKKPWG